jgi:hypothetical protein
MLFAAVEAPPALERLAEGQIHAAMGARDHLLRAGPSGLRATSAARPAHAANDEVDAYGNKEEKKKFAQCAPVPIDAATRLGIIDHALERTGSAPSGVLQAS